MTTSPRQPMSTVCKVSRVVETVGNILLLFALSVFISMWFMNDQRASAAPQPTVTLQVPHTPHEGVSR